MVLAISPDNDIRSVLNYEEISLVDELLELRMEDYRDLQFEDNSIIKKLEKKQLKFFNTKNNCHKKWQ